MSKVLKVLDAIAQAIYDKKGFNIIALDVQGLSTMTDYYLIAEGNIDRHVKGLSVVVEEVMSEFKEQLLHLDGGKTSEWLVMDYGEVVVHLFVPAYREKYALEQLWQEAKIVDLHIDVKKEEI